MSSNTLLYIENILNEEKVKKFGQISDRLREVINISCIELNGFVFRYQKNSHELYYTTNNWHRSFDGLYSGYSSPLFKLIQQNISIILSNIIMLKKLSKILLKYFYYFNQINRQDYKKIKRLDNLSKEILYMRDILNDEKEMKFKIMSYGEIEAIAISWTELNRLVFKYQKNAHQLYYKINNCSESFYGICPILSSMVSVEQICRILYKYFLSFNSIHYVGYKEVSDKELDESLFNEDYLNSIF